MGYILYNRIHSQNWDVPNGCDRSMHFRLPLRCSRRYRVKKEQETADRKLSEMQGGADQ